MSARATQTARALLPGVNLSAVGPRQIGRIKAHEGLLMEAAGFPVPVGTGVFIANANGTKTRGEVVGFRDSTALILPFSNDSIFAAGGRVERAGDTQSVLCGPALLGRVIDANGMPLDGRPAITSGMKWPLAGSQDNPLNRGRITQPFDTGIIAINALLSVGRGQRLAIVAGSGVGKSVLMGEMLSGAQCDICVVALVGERSREVSDFVETKLANAKAKTIVVAVPADHPPLLRLRAAMRATAIAESFRSAGKDVLLMIDSLTRVAHAQREIGLALGEPPTMKGYPPSALGIIPRIVERAGVDRASGGSITGLYTVLADGGDLEDPVVDSARAITDGHIILSRQMAEQGVYPAIDIAKSLSRTMADIVDEEHLAAAAHFRRLTSAYEENQDLLMMGAYSPGSDPALDSAIEQRPAMLEFLKQKPGDHVPFDAARSALITGQPI